MTMCRWGCGTLDTVTSRMLIMPNKNHSKANRIPNYVVDLYVYSFIYFFYVLRCFLGARKCLITILLPHTCCFILCLPTMKLSVCLSPVTNIKTLPLFPFYYLVSTFVSDYQYLFTDWFIVILPTHKYCSIVTLANHKITYATNYSSVINVQ